MNLGNQITYPDYYKKFQPVAMLPPVKTPRTQPCKYIQFRGDPTKLLSTLKTQRGVPMSLLPLDKIIKAQPVAVLPPVKALSRKVSKKARKPGPRSVAQPSSPLDKQRKHSLIAVEHLLNIHCSTGDAALVEDDSKEPAEDNSWTFPDSELIMKKSNGLIRIMN